MNILITDGIAPEGLKVLTDAGANVVESFFSPDELVNEIAKFDAIIVRSATKVTKEVIDASNLKVIARGGVGLDNIDVNYAKEKGIKVINTPGASAISVAELAIGQMFALSRFIHLSTSSMKEGKWAKKEFAAGIELTGKTLGIIGLGAIGREVAIRAKGLMMNVIAYDPYVQNSNLAELKSFDEVLSNSDFITLHVPLIKKGEYLIDTPQFNLMKDGVILINCARGGVVKESALVDALNSNKVKCAGVDVFENEPPTEAQSSLIAHKNVLLSPHIGASTEEGQLRVSTDIARFVLDALK